MNDHIKELADVASSQGCVVAAAVFQGPFRILVLLVQRGPVPSFRVTTWRVGDKEFGQGYYFAESGEAQLAFQHRVEGIYMPGATTSEQEKPDARAAGEAMAEWIAHYATDPSLEPVKSLLDNWDRANADADSR